MGDAQSKQAKGQAMKDTNTISEEELEYINKVTGDDEEQIKQYYREFMVGLRFLLFQNIP